MNKRSPTKVVPTTTESPPNAAPFAYGDYVAAKKRLDDAVQQKLFYGTVIGPTGTGKTSLMRDLRQGLDRHRHHVVYLSATRGSLPNIIRHFALSVHATPRRSSVENSRLITQAIREQGTHVIAWIDEAHRLSPEILAELTSLAEFDADATQVFSVVLSGPADLVAVLDEPRLAALRRRITVRSSLAGLRRDELDAFVRHRFGSVDDRRVPASLRDELFERTRSAPAVIDTVLRAALERADGGEVTEAILREVLDEQRI
jgi:type II secretory pathway predicted ATPase ExeA